MPAVKILLGKIADEWKSMAEEIARDEIDLSIVGEADKPIETLLKARDENVDIVVLSQEPDGSEPGLCSHFLLEYPNIVLVLVPVKGGPHVLCRTVTYREVETASKEAYRKMLRRKQENPDQEKTPGKPLL